MLEIVHTLPMLGPIPVQLYESLLPGSVEQQQGGWPKSQQPFSPLSLPFEFGNNRELENVFFCRRPPQFPVTADSLRLVQLAWEVLLLGGALPVITPF